MHPSKKVTLKDTALSGKTILLGITGSIAAVETVKLIRELLRHGAEIIPVMTKEAARLIHPNAIEFAAGRSPITEITGQVEHVLYCGDPESAVDLLLIAPATANTISKIACGIDDTTVTTMATTALGTGVPVLVSPSMHGTMYEHEIVLENIEKLKEMGVGFIDPAVSEGKAKMPSFLRIVEEAIRKISLEDRYFKGSMVNKMVLIIGGSTAQPLDSMRMLTNRSSGHSAVTLAVEGYRRGAVVKVWYGKSQAIIPDWIPFSTFGTVEDVVEMVDSEEHDLNGYDIIILCAAISDYSPDRREGKITSGEDELVVRMSPTPKVIELIRKRAPEAILVGYKAESGIPVKELISKARKRMVETGSNIMVANLLEDVGEETTKVYIVMSNDDDPVEVQGTRQDVASKVFDTILDIDR